MFGYIICNPQQLKEESQKRYRSIHCGVCKSIGKQFGQMERLSLSYDMTFLALFLSALYEPIEDEYECHCIVHPFRQSTIVDSKYVEYAAAMGIALTYYKCIDDWKDDKNILHSAYGNMIKKSYQEVEGEYPVQCEMIKKSLKAIEKEEQTENSDVDKVINYSGMMLSELFIYEEDYWSNTLRGFGYELGRFIYLMDAVVDYSEDVKRNNFNPLIILNKQPKEMETYLANILGNATRYFEELPIFKDEDLIRNILYSGVWIKYNEKYGGNG